MNNSTKSLVRTGLITLIIGLMVLGAYMCKTNSKYLNFFTGDSIANTDTLYLPGSIDTVWYPDTVLDWRYHPRPTKIRWREKIDTHYIDTTQQNTSGAIEVDSIIYYSRITTHEFANAVFKVIDSLEIIGDSIHHNQRVEFTNYIEKEVINHYDTVRITNTVVDTKLRIWVGAGTDYNFLIDDSESKPTSAPIIFSLQNHNFEVGLSKDIMSPQGHFYIKMPIRKFFRKNK